MIECQIYSAHMKKEWDLFIEQAKTPLFFFKRDFLEYHADRFIDSSLMFYSDNKLVAVFPATKNDDNLISHAGMTFGGLIVFEKTRAETIQEVFFCLAEKARELGYTKIVYKAIPYIFYTQPAQEDLYFLVNKLSAKLIRRDLSSVVYLNNRLKLSENRKRMVAKARKMGLEVTTSTNYTSFHNLLAEVLKRHSAKPVHSIEELNYLSQLFPENLVLKVINYEDNCIAATLLFKFKNVVHTQYLATSETGKNLGALDYLIETCIEDALREGYLYFSLGISTEQQGTVLNDGLIDQKERFGARGITLDFYEIPLQ